MGSNALRDISSEMEVDAIKCLFPLRYHERHLVDSVRPDTRPLGRARDTTLHVAMLAAIKMKVKTPTTESPNEGCIAIDFHMPPICSSTVRPRRPVETAPVLSKQLSDTIFCSGMIDLKDLCLVPGKAAWMAYLWKFQ